MPYTLPCCPPSMLKRLLNAPTIFLRNSSGRSLSFGQSPRAPQAHPSSSRKRYGLPYAASQLWLVRNCESRYPLFCGSDPHSLRVPIVGRDLSIWRRYPSFVDLVHSSFPLVKDSFPDKALSRERRCWKECIFLGPSASLASGSASSFPG